MKLRNIFTTILVLISLNLVGQRTAIIGAMPEEIELLTQSLKHKKVKDLGGIKFYTGTLQNKKVVVFKSGIGKVNAAYATTMLLEKFKIMNIVFTGVAGGLHPESYPGDIVIGSGAFHHDYARFLSEDYIVRATRNIDGVAANPLVFACDSSLIAIAKSVEKTINLKEIENHKPNIFYGLIATGDVFISNTVKAKELFEKHNALAAEMEGAAVAQVAYMKRIPFLIIRSCSDNANNNAHVDFQKFVKPAAENAIEIVMGMLKKM